MPRNPDHQELTDPVYAYRYAAYVVKGPWPEGEAVIAKKASTAFHYANSVLHARWIPGEAVIANDPDYAWRYAIDIVWRRWPLGEPAILTDPDAIDLYTKMLRRLDPEGYAEFQLEHGDWTPNKVEEDGFSSALREPDRPETPRPPTEQELADPAYAFEYAMDEVQGPFPDGEAIIATSPMWSYYYAKDVLWGPFPLGEKAIAQNGEYAYFYALDVLKARFPAGDAIIANTPQRAPHYAAWLKRNDPEGYEEFQLEHGDWAPKAVAEAALAKARSSDAY